MLTIQRRGRDTQQVPKHLTDVLNDGRVGRADLVPAAFKSAKRNWERTDGADQNLVAENFLPIITVEPATQLIATANTAVSGYE